MRQLEGDFDYIVVGAGTAGCIMANRLSADPSKPRPGAGSRRQRQLDLVSHSGRLSLCDRQSALRLDVPHRGRAGAQRPLARLSARQGDRRLLRNQRHDLDAGPGRRLRSLAATRAHRLGLGRRAAAFHKAGGSFPRRERASRHGRRMAHRGAAAVAGTSSMRSAGGARRWASAKIADFNTGDNEGIGYFHVNRSAAGAGRRRAASSSRCCRGRTCGWKPTCW